MRRDLVALLHAGYWGLYLLLVGFILLMLRMPHGGGRPVSGVLAAWPLLVLSVVPNAVAFYSAYGPLFTRFLARRRVAPLLGGAAAAGVATTLVGLMLARLFFGARQPAFSSGMELASLAVCLWTVAAIHTTIGLVVRGFVNWYGDIAVKEALTRKTHETELALLRARLDPHFLFNTLNNIDVLISRDPAAASRYLHELSDIMRFVLYEAKGNAIPLAAELSYMEKYIGLERIRARSAGYASHEVIGDPSGVSIAPMTFIPFVENAFKHAEGLKGDDAISSRVCIDGGRITFECRNRVGARHTTPPGTANALRDRCATEDPAPGGLGNSLIRERLQLLYPGRHALDATDREGTYFVRLTIETA